MNTTLWAKRFSVAAMAIVAAGLVGLYGCGGKDEEPKHDSIEGKVKHIDTATGEVRMLRYNPKEKRDQEISGTLAPDAEIFINGRTAELKDVRVDDLVQVTGRVEKYDGERKLVAVKVHITRPTDTEPAETSEPATQPQT